MLAAVAKAGPVVFLLSAGGADLEARSKDDNSLAHCVVCPAGDFSLLEQGAMSKKAGPPR